MSWFDSGISRNMCNFNSDRFKHFLKMCNCLWTHWEVWWLAKTLNNVVLTIPHTGNNNYWMNAFLIPFASKLFQGGQRLEYDVIVAIPENYQTLLGKFCCDTQNNKRLHLKKDIILFDITKESGLTITSGVIHHVQFVNPLIFDIRNLCFSSDNNLVTIILIITDHMTIFWNQLKMVDISMASSLFVFSEYLIC